MTRYLYALFVGLILFACGCNEPKTNDSDLSAMSSEAREALDRAAKVYPIPLAGASWKTVHCGSGENAVYQVRGLNARGNRIEAEITKAGRIIEVEEHGIPLAEVPPTVTDALKTKMPDFTTERVEAIYQTESTAPVAYGFEGKNKTGKPIEIYIAADGMSFLN